MTIARLERRFTTDDGRHRDANLPPEKDPDQHADADARRCDQMCLHALCSLERAPATTADRRDRLFQGRQFALHVNKLALEPRDF